MTQNGSSASGSTPRFSHLGGSFSEADAAYIRSNADLLCVLIDVDPAVWARKGGGSSNATTDETAGLKALRKACQDVCIFLNAHAALRHDNCCAVYAAGRSTGTLIYSNTPSLSRANTLSSQPDANTFQPFKIIDDAVMSGVQQALKDEREELGRPALHGIVSALAQSLCHINRVGQLTSMAAGGVSEADEKKHSSGRGYRSRILVITASPDSSSQYVAMMNCIFGAQKKNVTVDVCKILGGEDSVFLQQACHLTKGVYFRLDGVQGLLQTLMSTFLASPSLRDQIRLPSNDDVDFRAACFCHGNVVDIGYVCSVCLSIYCQPRQRCLTCRAAFPIRTLTRFQEERNTVSISSS